MKIYNHEKEEKWLTKTRNDQIANIIAIGLLFAVGLGYLIYGFVDKEAETLGVSLAIIAISIILLPWPIIKYRKERASFNIRYQEICDLVENRSILKMLELDEERLDCIKTKLGVEIGYLVGEYLYFNLLIDAKTYSFSMELMDAVYDFKYFDKMIENPLFDGIDIYQEEKFSHDISKETIIKTFLTYIENNYQKAEEINNICSDYQDLEEVTNEKA